MSGKGSYNGDHGGVGQSHDGGPNYSDGGAPHYTQNRDETSNTSGSTAQNEAPKTGPTRKRVNRPHGFLNRIFGGGATMLLPQAKLAGPMRWVIAIMVALTVIASAGGLSLSNLVSGSRAELAGGVTVQIIEPLPPERAKQAEAAEQVLKNAPGVVEVRRVPDAELDALLEPWLGSDARNESVPIPALLDVRLDEAADESSIEALRAEISQVAPSARVDAQSDWLEPVFAAMSALQWLAVGLIVLLAVTSAAAVWLAARSALGSNRGTIEIIHLLGGTDNQVARIFQRSVGIDAALGGTAGLAIGLVIVLIFARQFAALNSGVVGSGGLTWIDWVLIVLVPVGGVVIAVFTARLTVLTALRRML